MKYCYVKNQCLVIRLPGEIDHYQAEDIRQECEMMFLKACVRDVIFDFTGTNFMDSSGIGLILGRLRQVQPMEGESFCSEAVRPWRKCGKCPVFSEK